ncbi:hypothetical protein AB0N88_15940 [Streptomyces sp. NPDC093516]|uniref:hypothetical protein n=1 Tax=Streptomyces sp. NPDC093516 TaxID=3155304 RepID=UPI00344338A0
MGDQFSADVSRIRQWQSLMREIAKITDGSVRRFEDGVRATYGWTGDDQFGKSLAERDKKERENTTTTGTSLMQAISGISTALRANGNVIQGAQNNANDGISDEANKSGKH